MTALGSSTVTSADPERDCDDDAFFPDLSNALSTLSLVLAGWASSGNWPDWEIIPQNRKDGWFSPGLKHCKIEARSMQSQFSPLFPGTTGGPHTQLRMLLTANLIMVSLLTAIQPNITEQWRKCEFTDIVNYQNYEFYTWSKQCLIHFSHEFLN